MARLLINPGTPQAWEIQLKPGLNSLGRSAANDFPIEHASVSGAHCQIIVNGETASIRDLGSTNGTFVNRAAIQETVLQPGQTLHLGAVEMLFNADPPARSPVRVALTIARTHEEPPATPPIALALDVPEAPITDSVLHYCKFHPRTPARLFCRKCNKYFCELCVGTRRMGNETHRFCRMCSNECISLEVDLSLTVPQHRSFSHLVPGAFVYPLKGIGPYLVFFGGIFFPAAAFAAKFFLYVWVASLLVYGYLFACLQHFVVCTSQGEDKPSWPDVTSIWEDILSPLFKFVCMCLLMLGPGLGFIVLTAQGHEWAPLAIIPSFILGALYFPMALLAVAMFDSLAALNPLIIIPSILKVPLQYLLVLGILGLIVLARWGGELALALLIPIPVVPGIISSFFWLYFLTVEARILGLLYLSNKDRLGWFS